MLSKFNFRRKEAESNVMLQVRFLKIPCPAFNKKYSHHLWSLYYI